MTDLPRDRPHHPLRFGGIPHYHSFHVRRGWVTFLHPHWWTIQFHLTTAGLPPHPETLMRLIKRWIVRIKRKLGVAPTWFCSIELDPDTGRAHAHGVLAGLPASEADTIRSLWRHGGKSRVGPVTDHENIDKLLGYEAKQAGEIACCEYGGPGFPGRAQQTPENSRGEETRIPSPPIPAGPGSLPHPLDKVTPSPSAPHSRPGRVARRRRGGTRGSSARWRPTMLTLRPFRALSSGLTYLRILPPWSIQGLPLKRVSVYQFHGLHHALAFDFLAMGLVDRCPVAEALAAAHERLGAQRVADHMGRSTEQWLANVIAYRPALDRPGVGGVPGIVLVRSSPHVVRLPYQLGCRIGAHCLDQQICDPEVGRVVGVTRTGRAKDVRYRVEILGQPHPVAADEAEQERLLDRIVDLDALVQPTHGRLAQMDRLAAEIRRQAAPRLGRL